MDLMTVILSCVCAIPIQFAVMFFVYSRWILPAISKMVQDLPPQIRGMIEPFVDEKLTEIKDTVKKSSARFQRTVNQAIDGLDLNGYDITTEEGQEEIKNTIAKKYGMDVAIQSLVQILQSIGAKKPQSNKEVSTW